MANRSSLLFGWLLHTVGDETGTTAKINRRVTQGGPASPTLCNIYFDTLAPQFARLLYVTLIQSKLDYASILTPVDGLQRSERVRLDMRRFKTILGISVQPHHVSKLREVFRNEAPYWRRRRLCQAFSRGLLGMAERGVQENEEAGQFGAQARRTLDALESNSWFLSNVEDPRKPQCPQQEYKIIIGFKKKMIKKWKRPFSILNKRLPVCLRLGNWKQRKMAVR